MVGGTGKVRGKSGQGVQERWAVNERQAARKGAFPQLTRQHVGKGALLVALLTPLLLVGFGILGSNPSYRVFGMFAGVFTMIAALLGLMAVRSRGWLLLPGTLLVIALFTLPAVVFPSELMLHRGVQTEVTITAAHGYKGKNGTVDWSCDIRRTDGKPLPHAVLGSEDCYGQSQVGTTETVLVDPGGWAPPVGADMDYSGVDVGGYLTGAAAVLWAGMVLLVARGRRRRG